MILKILQSDWANLFYIVSFIYTLITLLVLVQYASDTKTIATQARETNLMSLRPLILRSGIINDWKDVNFEIKDGVIQGQPLTFVVLKNVAANINGYIVINGNKYTLLFDNDISRVATDTYKYYQTWGWMKPDATLYAKYLPDKKETTNKLNQIYISYADIEGNRYCTIDDKSLNNPQSFPVSQCDKATEIPQTIISR